jgi:MATE family multidrug resistance protein
MSARVRALAQQAAPMILSRAGLAAMTLASAALTARQGSGELAALTLSEGTFGRIADICFAAMLSGAVLVAGARGDQTQRLVSWRRAVAASLTLGLLGIAAAAQAPALLRLIGQSPALVERAAPVMLTMSLGLPAGLVAVACAVHLEAIGRAGLVARWLVGANLVNLLLGATLIDGAFGATPHGAEGAAIAAALVRWLLAAGLVATLRAVEGPGLFMLARESVGEQGRFPCALWPRSLNAVCPRSSLSRKGAITARPGSATPATAAAPARHGAPVIRVSPNKQIALGATAAGTSAGMHALGVWLTIFAGWLGGLPLAAYSSAWTLNLPGLVMALGVADAIAIRAAAAKAHDADAVKGDLFVLSAGLAILAFGLAAAAGPLARAYALDPALSAALAELLPLSALALWLDGVSMGVFAALRAQGDIAAPTAIQIGSMAATAPLAWALALHFGLGAPGLFLAILPTSAVRLALMGFRLNRAPAALMFSEKPL